MPSKLQHLVFGVSKGKYVPVKFQNYVSDFDELDKCSLFFRSQTNASLVQWFDHDLIVIACAQKFNIIIGSRSTCK